jgi:lysophospholipase L1-like esterase
MFSRYLALGDSMSIDLYPALDAGEMDVAVALERRAAAGVVAPIGAASLLHANDDARWPEFAGRDLQTLSPGLGGAVLAVDGATIGDVFSEQLPDIEPGDDPALVTLTLGGNDLLGAFGGVSAATRRMSAAVRDITQAYSYLVGEITRALPDATLVLTTVYDPTDGTGRAPGLFDGRGTLPLEHLDAVNDHIRRVADETPGARLADAHAHFLGHGVSAPEDDRWYWRRSIIEPSAAGASEIRRVWLDVLEL